jgi:hypothetical protein
VVSHLVTRARQLRRALGADRRLLDGWDIQKTSRGHFRLTGPRGEIVFTSVTISDFRWRKNFLTQLRRALRREGRPS